MKNWIKNTILISLGLLFVSASKANTCLRSPDSPPVALEKAEERKCDQALAEVVETSKADSTQVTTAYGRLVKNLVLNPTENRFLEFFAEAQGQNWSVRDRRILLQVIKRWLELYPQSSVTWRKHVLMDLEEAERSSTERLKIENPDFQFLNTIPGWEDVRLQRNSRPLNVIDLKTDLKQKANWSLYSSAKQEWSFWGDLTELTGELRRRQLTRQQPWPKPAAKLADLLPEPRPFGEMKMPKEKGLWQKPTTWAAVIGLGLIAGFALKDKTLVIRR